MYIKTWQSNVTIYLYKHHISLYEQLFQSLINDETKKQNQKQINLYSFYLVWQ